MGIESSNLTAMPVTRRYPFVDLLRGVAIALMIAYHFSYDLAHFGLAAFDFYTDPFWLQARTLIVSLFLGLVGVSLVLASAHGIDWRRYARRLGLLLAFALAITLNSYFMFPGRTIVFGILHFIAFASVLALPLVERPRLALGLGLGLIGLDRWFSHPLFDTPALHWLGLMTHKPATEDYVPVIPWFGVVLIGITLGHAFLRSPAWRGLRDWHAQYLPARGLALAGRHSLLIYMLHQPLLFGGLWLLTRLGSGA